MKKLILIVLIASFIVSIGIMALAEVKFGDWNKWDEQLPAAENESWYWAVSDNEPRVWNLKGFGDEGTDIVLLFSDLYFYGDKKGKTKASVIFYSSDMDVKKWDIPNAALALVVFPPIKKIMTIRAYKMEDDKVFKFFEQWEILSKDQEIVVSQNAKFRKIFKEWLKKQMSPERTVPEDMVEAMLPELVIWEKKFFRITDSMKFNEK